METLPRVWATASAGEQVKTGVAHLANSVTLRATLRAFAAGRIQAVKERASIRADGGMIEGL
jgi:hypothetical protein